MEERAGTRTDEEVCADVQRLAVGGGLVDANGLGEKLDHVHHLKQIPLALYQSTAPRLQNDFMMRGAGVRGVAWSAGGLPPP